MDTHGDPVNLQFNTKDSSVQVSSGDIMTKFIACIDTVKKLNTLTGLPSFEHLNLLCSELSSINISKRSRKLCLRERETVICLAELLKCAIPWPSKDEILNNMPLCFNNFKHVRVVLDCTEIPIQKPKCLKCRLKLYSHYKSGLTLKFMTGVTPAGLISYISPAFGGKASDKAIFVQSGLLDKLEKNDAIMVDKGFLIDQECFAKGITIVRPSFLTNKVQFCKKEALLNREIAAARVHIERSNQRIKMFKFFNSRFE
ncbi:hypothetical protein PPYR_00779 [Photinus pyralis]|uniref:DDE Tnp4 domain-containing protein n=1 Tax=Photinus pyralis TaxID=7054 RepID=A0A5N4B2H4_PHOPY|nr:hypothetical protein PPYR_00779 [Photinus pyralis]